MQKKDGISTVQGRRSKTLSLFILKNVHKMLANTRMTESILQLKVEILGSSRHPNLRNCFLLFFSAWRAWDLLFGSFGY
jgi:hypothetical protein